MTPTMMPITYGMDASCPRFSVARYQKMISAGIFTPEDKLELLENWLVLKMMRTPLHDGTLGLVEEALHALMTSGWRHRILSALVLADSMPEPDIAVLRGHVRSYLTHYPTAADAGLVIEVADSSLLRDQRDKTRIYARASIPTYWIVNIVDLRIEVYSQPSGPTALPAYGSFQLYQSGDAIPFVLDGTTVATIAVADLLP